MFLDYPYLCELRERLEHLHHAEQNRMLNHLRWLLARGDDVLPTMKCPQCRERSVIQFVCSGTAVQGYLFTVEHTFCPENGCQESALKRYAERGLRTNVFPLAFSTIKEADDPEFHRRITRLLREVHALPDLITAEEAFVFFRSTRN